MRYMIHSTPSRTWYVNDFLIPSMIQQGIKEKEIIVRCDTDGEGNLTSCMKSFLYCGQNTAEGTWHLQDDVIISRDFAEATKTFNQGIVCGAVVKEWGPDYTRIGIQPVQNLWYSFQCIRIPDEIAGECAVWFFTDASKRTNYKYSKRVKRKKHDDDFFQFFLFEKHPGMQILNLKPNIVDHIDYLIGGSLINDSRERKINRMFWFKDKDLVEDLEKKLEEYRAENM